MKILLAVFLLVLAAPADEWEGFDYEFMGLTRQEFKTLRESGITLKKFYELSHLGIRPQEYLSQPWRHLWVTEEEWLKQRKLGMSDDDIDQSWREVFLYRNHMWVSLAIPSYYQFKHQRPIQGGIAVSIFASGIASWAFAKYAWEDPNAERLLALALLGNIYSFADAWMSLPKVLKDNGRQNFGLRPLITPSKIELQLALRF